MAGAFDDLIKQYAPSSGRLEVIEGRSNVGPAEARSVETGATQSEMARQFINQLARIEALNALLPATGRFASKIASVEQNLPSRFQRKYIPVFQQMQQVANSILLPAANLQSGQPLGASQINSERELEHWMKTVPSPSMEKTAITATVDNLARLALERMARENFARVWRDQLGSLSARNPAGRTFEQEFGEFLASPKSEPLRVPLSKRVREAQARRAAAAQKRAAGNGWSYLGTAE